MEVSAIVSKCITLYTKTESVSEIVKEIRDALPVDTKAQQHLWLKRNVKGGFMLKLQKSKPTMSKGSQKKAWVKVMHCLLGTFVEHGIKLKSSRAKYKKKFTASAKPT